MKRVFDIVVAAAVLVVASPLLLVIALLLLVSHGRPVLFRQERVGMGGELFRIRKFRTMRPQAGPQVTSAGDRRIHGVGRWLRANKLDELPQLLDVLEGSMSLVGPRPELPKYVDLWPPSERRKILSVRPGITDPTAIIFRHESELLANQPDPEHYYVDVVLPQKVKAYAEYVEHQTLVGDIATLVRTVGAVMGGRT